MNEEKIIFCTREQFEKLKALDWLKDVINRAIQSEREFVTDEITRNNQDRKEDSK